MIGAIIGAAVAAFGVWCAVTLPGEVYESDRAIIVFDPATGAATGYPK